jgi:Putative metal-binding motif
MLRLAAILCAVVACGLAAPSIATAGTFDISGGVITFTGEDVADDISGFLSGSNIIFTRFGGADINANIPCQETGDGQGVSCPTAHVTLVILNMRGGNDVASVSSNVRIPVLFVGGDGNDGLFGGGGLDQFVGGIGDDNLVARDGRPERVDCGAGHDTAITDDADTRISCEEVEGDADLDGVRAPADCNDANPSIHPGAFDVPDDGVDQDCSGADATNLDRDGDGFPRPQDCNDRNRRVHPGAREIAGNSVDENCDTVVEPFPPIRGTLFGAWSRVGSGTRNISLSARRFPRRTRIVMRCTGGGCPFRTATRRVRGRRVNLHGPLGRSVLRPGARLEVRFTLARHIGRVIRFRMVAPGGLPNVAFLCKPPGRRARDC